MLQSCDGRCDCPAHQAEDNWREEWAEDTLCCWAELRWARPTLVRAGGSGPEPEPLVLSPLSLLRLRVSVKAPGGGRAWSPRAGDQSSDSGAPLSGVPGPMFGSLVISPWRCCHGAGARRPGRGEAPLASSSLWSGSEDGDCPVSGHEGRCFMLGAFKKTERRRADLIWIGQMLSSYNCPAAAEKIDKWLSKQSKWQLCFSSFPSFQGSLCRIIVCAESL